MAGKKQQDTVEVGGVEYPVYRERISDVRFSVMLGDLEDESVSDADKIAVQARALRFLFGGDPSARDRALDQAAEAAGGILTQEAFSTWFAAYMKAVGAKN